ncbi:MAG: YjbQ family protein [Desulfobacteraceae bacterium]|nr:YjbQ family protein [Desulfobacteraceae bacterium]
MNYVKQHCEQISIRQETGPGINDITFDAEKIVKASKIQTGSAHITAIGSTGSVTSIEYESGVIDDLKKAVNRIAPPDGIYKHELAWHDGNGHSHIQAAIIGPSIVVPVRGGTLKLGTWQQIVVLNHDNHSRKRLVEVTVTGI